MCKWQLASWEPHALRLTCAYRAEGETRVAGWLSKAAFPDVPETGFPARLVCLISSDGLHPILPCSPFILWKGLPSPVCDSLILVLFSGLISSLPSEATICTPHPSLRLRRLSV